MPKYQRAKGTEDLTPPASGRWRRVEQRMTRLFSLYGYREIRTPAFESSDLFARGLGDTSDIVTKEMYTFEDRGGRSLTLRPEGTAPTLRALIENSLIQSKSLTRVFYLGPMFRYERPQKGRSRQFHQYGVEAVGSENPAVDAEMIEMMARLYEDLGLTGYKILLNSIGCPQCRPPCVERLKAFVTERLDSFCPQCKARVEQNPLRVMDCKVEECQKVLAEAPLIVQSLCADCDAHFKKVRELLDAFEIDYALEPRLVRGLDYYMRTTFEFQHADALGAQNALLGGGRYDDLMSELGGPDMPGVGFAGGMERLMMSLPSESHPDAPLDFYIATLGEKAFRKGLKLAARLRRGNYCVEQCFDERSLKSQMREANRLGASNTIILGEDEIEQKVLVLKSMAKDGTQETLSTEQLFERLQRRDEIL